MSTVAPVRTGPATVRVAHPRDVPQALLDKYATSGPRYTSYPTAPHFQSQFDREAVEERWRRSNDTGAGLSLYVHIPFCRKRCLFCGCHLEVGNSRHRATNYVQVLFGEAERLPELIDPARPLQQLALGGGTPTFLTPEVMSELVNGLKARFNFDPNIEQSIEIDPLTVDEQYLDVLIGLGFNRFSYGVQDFDADVQLAVGRVQDEAKIFRNVRYLQARGYDSINLDLIYGLPKQTLPSFRTTIDKVIDAHPSRIALFGYAHVPWVSPHQKKLEFYNLPSPDERVDLFGQAAEQLLAAGYEQVGMDHFALPDDELIRALHAHSLNRNFMGYTTKRGLDLVGLGASSISYVGNTFAQNVKPVDEYLERAATNPWSKALLMTDEDVLRGEVILELMCNLYLDIRAIERKYGIDFADHFADALEQLEPMEADGLLSVDRDSIVVSDIGPYFIRNISMCFDEYLKKDAPAATYSRTI